MMFRPLRCVLFYLLIGLFPICAWATPDEDIELAESLIKQDDCDNALPILATVYKDPASDKKRTLLAINVCAEKTLNYTLKETTELKLLKLEPKNPEVQLRYLDSLFYLSKYKDIISYSRKSKNLVTKDDYWVLLGRSLYEMNENERSILAFSAYLKISTIKKKDEAFYWLIKNHIQLEEFNMAQEYLDKLSVLPEIAPWIKERIQGLQDYITVKNKRFSFSAKLQAGTDNNILRLPEKISDTTVISALYFDYKLLNKSKNTLTVGLDLDYQGYSKNSDYQSMSYAPRIGQAFDMFAKVKGEYLISGGKSQTNFKADQDYLFISAFFYVPASDTFELQPSLTYFENLNNTPTQQYNVSLTANVYFERSFFWFGPFYRISSAPEPEIDATSFSVPVVVKYSLTSRYTQTGALTGYQMSLGESWSLLGQYSITQSKYKPIDLSGFDSTQVDNFEDRADITQSVKLTLGYRQSSQFRYSLAAGISSMTSKGFQGFNTPDVPVNAYTQQQVLLGVTYKSP